MDVSDGDRLGILHSQPLKKIPVSDYGRTLQQAGLPMVLMAVREAVEALLDHPGISAISFVGSTLSLEPSTNVEPNTSGFRPWVEQKSHDHHA